MKANHKKNIRSVPCWSLIIGGAIAMFCISTGCKKYLDVDLPSNLTLTKDVFSNVESANGAMLNVYGQMFNGTTSPYYLSLTTGLSADELIPYDQSLQSMFLNKATSEDFFTNTFWTTSYNMIYQANAVYEGSATSTTLSENLKQQLQGEALFIRAYLHFLLYNLYGDVPIVITTNYEKNAVVTRNNKMEVYAQIVADLKSSITLLNDKYVDANGTTESKERIRPNRLVASALLARVYLYMGDFQQAENLATTLIDNSNYALTDINGVFAANSMEAIWQLKFVAGSFFNTTEAINYILSSSPALSSQSEISKQLLSAFDDSDLRRTSWIAKYTDNDVVPTVDYYYPFKYKVRFGADGKEYSTVLRLAEQFLIRAESRAQLNKLPEAINDLDIIRKRANLPLISVIKPGISKSALLDLVLAERRREFFIEQGHRWFDLKRTRTIDNVMSTVTPAKGGGKWTPVKQLWPIPETELITNPNIKQNEGY